MKNEYVKRSDTPSAPKLWPGREEDKGEEERIIKSP